MRDVRCRGRRFERWQGVSKGTWRRQRIVIFWVDGESESHYPAWKSTMFNYVLASFKQGVKGVFGLQPE